MNIDKLFNNSKLLKQQYHFYIKKKQLLKIEKDNDLIDSHLEKAKHNMLFFSKNKNDSKFNDWLIVTLYYALYHSVLALIINKNYVSKNHTASLIFLIKHYSYLKNEIKLLHDLSIKKEDAELYTNLKEDRHTTSYQTNIYFSKEKINEYKIKVLDFINKTEEIIDNSE
jgi:uncharacterized protein (UPF0332 family)